MMRFMMVLVALLLAANCVLAAAEVAPISYDATSSDQLVALNWKVPSNERRVLQNTQFSKAWISAGDAEDTVFSLWKISVSGTDTTYARPTPFTTRGDTIGTVPAGKTLLISLDGSDCLFFSAGSGVVVVE